MHSSPVIEIRKAVLQQSMNDNPDESCGLRERKKRQTAQALHRAALELVHLEGLEAATVSRIAEAAGVSQRTFFNYFATKEAAVLGIPHDIDQRVARSFALRPEEEDVWVSILEVAMTVFDRDPANQELSHDIYMRYPEIARGLLDASIKSRAAGLEAVAQRLIAQGVSEDNATDRAHILIEVGNSMVSTAAHLARSKKIDVREALQIVQATLAEELA